MRDLFRSIPVLLALGLVSTGCGQSGSPTQPAPAKTVTEPAKPAKVEPAGPSQIVLEVPGMT